MNLRFKEWNYEPLTIGLWRPYNVEVGFIEDYIKRNERTNRAVISIK
jgi:hypothetical protein